jgi:hypothetical protein
MIDTKKLARYELLTVSATQLKSEWEAVEAERDEIRREILGEPVVVKDSAASSDKKADKPRKVLSAWERLRRQPPPALKATVAVVKELGTATNKAVAEKLGVSVIAASLRLSRAARDGFLNRVAQGAYEVNPLGGVMIPPKR